MQIESFAELLEKYKDMDTSSGNKSLEKVIFRLNQSFTYFYFIENNLILFIITKIKMSYDNIS